MNESIQKALKALEQANTAGYFEEMDKVEIPTHLKPTYAQFKGVFMHGQAPWDFSQKLETFAQVVNQAQNQGSKSDELDKKALKEEVLLLIPKDIDEAFEKLDELLGETNGTYNDLCREYINRPNNFDMATFRSKLIRFVRRGL